MAFNKEGEIDISLWADVDAEVSGKVEGDDSGNVNALLRGVGSDNNCVFMQEYVTQRFVNLVSYKINYIFITNHCPLVL